MNWTKLGQIIQPNPKYFWMESYAGPSFVRSMPDGMLWIYITGRDRLNQSRVGLVKATLLKDVFTVVEIVAQPVFDLGELGCFDESGVSYPWLVEFNNQIYMYYVGWMAGGKNRFLVFTGLAVSNDDGLSFERVQKVPILERTIPEPYGSGSCAVFKNDRNWMMYYTAYEGWEEFEGKNKPWYNIRLATSDDGINWVRNQQIIIDFDKPGEHVIGKPQMLYEEGIYKLWYSYRGESYRIGYAESTDGIHYIRKDNEVGIDVSSEGWDSEMIEYSFVFDHMGSRYMIYNGNSFGLTGIGLAKLTGTL